jgi:hypothetical protein
MSATYPPSSTRKEPFGKAPIKKVELFTSIKIDAALTDKTRTKRSKLESLSEGSEKSSQAAGAIEEVAAIASEMTRVDVRRGEQWRWMVAKKMSRAPVVVAETALTLSRGNPLGWVSIRRKNSSAYEKRQRIEGSVDK